eukprot:scaffold12318_cov74-Phaeocystis_antarctica.AAC.5
MALECGDDLVPRRARSPPASPQPGAATNPLIPLSDRVPEAPLPHPEPLHRQRLPQPVRGPQRRCVRPV